VQEPAKSGDAKSGSGAAKPHRIAVADADGDVSAFSKVLGKKPGKDDKPGKDEKAAEAAKPKPVGKDAAKETASAAKPHASVATTGSLRN
jgi:hypothetical protein